MPMNRRDFFRCSSAAAALVVAPRLVFANGAKSGNRDVLVMIFQRGGMDGLNAVVPYADPDYYRLRPAINVPRPGSATGAALDLDGFYGLHPSLSALLPLYSSGELAIVHATGYRHDSRSHFECQDHLERGTLHLHETTSGWLNRHLQVIGGDANFQAVGFGGSIQASLRGSAPVIGMSNIADFKLATSSNQKSALESALAGLYDANTLFAATSVQALDAVHELASENPAQYPVENGANWRR